MDNYEVETFMRMHLEPQFLKDEKMMWCGVTENDVKPKEYSETKSRLIGMGICTFLGVLFAGTAVKDAISGSFDNVIGGLFVGLILLGVAGLLFYLYFIYRKTRYYAVTNYRVYILDENGTIVYSQRMKSDYKIRYYKSSRSIGWVEVFKKERKIDIDDAYERYYNKAIVTFRGIKDLEKAYHCINRLIIESANKTDNRADFSKVLFNI
ncbi:MAG: hypothetical protein IKV85_00360 [Ruminococcus sp.]|nr:hypothetical protein [Ruminococcus sp.]